MTTRQVTATGRRKPKYQQPRYFWPGLLLITVFLCLAPGGQAQTGCVPSITNLQLSPTQFIGGVGPYPTSIPVTMTISYSNPCDVSAIIGHNTLQVSGPANTTWLAMQFLDNAGNAVVEPIIASANSAGTITGTATASSAQLTVANTTIISTTAFAVRTDGQQGTPVTVQGPSVTITPNTPAVILSITPNSLTSGTNGTVSWSVSESQYAYQRIALQFDPPGYLFAVAGQQIGVNPQAPTITSPVQVSVTLVPSFWAFDLGQWINGPSTNAVTITLSPLAKPNGQKFVLNFGQDGNGTTLVHEFDADTHSISQPFIVKLGNQFPVEIVPIKADGSTGDRSVIRASIEDPRPAIPFNGGGSTIPGPAIVLFKDKVLLHLAASQSESHHDFFPIHSGTANIKLTFTFNGKEQVLSFPVQVTSCVVNGDCDPQMTGNSSFDNLIMVFSDRNGIPPQLIKAQVERESSFDKDAWRYEPLSYDWKVYHPDGTLQAPASEQSWSLAEGDAQCAKQVDAAGTGIGNNLAGPDVSPRHKLGVVTVNDVPSCHVTEVPSPLVGRHILPSDTLVSMENILYANDACIIGACLGYSSINSVSFKSFTETFQDSHDPFSAQTGLASSYGLHQLMYDTAVNMGYKGTDKQGLPPHLLFDPFTSLDLGSRYLASKYQENDGSEDVDFPDFAHFLFQYGPALRSFNGPPHLGFDEIFGKCGTKPYSPAPQSAKPKEKAFDYPCLILTRTTHFAPAALIFMAPTGGN